MNIKELKSDSVELHLEVKIPAKDFEATVDKELAKVSKTAKMDGFRKGKVPTSLLKKRYNASLRMDALRDAITKAIQDIKEERKLRTIGEPEIDGVKNEENKDIEFSLKFSLLPEIKMPDWSKVAIEKPVLDIVEQDVDERMKELTKMSVSFDKETKAKAKKGEQVTIDAVGSVDGVAFDGGKLDDYKLVLGSMTFIPGFEDQLIGAKAGDEVKVEVPFPKDYHASNLAGKDAVFDCKVKAVHKPVEPEINDEFAKKFQCENVDKLKDQIKESFALSYDEAILTVMKRRLFDKLEDQLKFDVPASLLDKETQMLQSQTEQAQEEPEEVKGKSAKEKEKYYADLASRRVKLGLLLAEYVSENKMEISQDDIRNAIMAQARSFPGQEQQIFQYYSQNQQALESLKGPVLEEKAVKDIFANKIKVTDKKYKKDALEKLLNEE